MARGSGSKSGGLASKHGSTGKLTKKLGSMAQLAHVFSVAPAAAGGAGGGVGGAAGGKVRVKDTEAYWQKTLSLRNTSIALEDILQVGSLCSYLDAPTSCWRLDVCCSCMTHGFRIQ